MKIENSGCIYLQFSVGNPTELANGFIVEGVRKGELIMTSFFSLNN